MSALLERILAPVRTVIGREPAAVVAAVEAVLAFIVTFGIPGLTAEDAARWLAIAAAFGTAITAWATVNTRVSVVVGIIRALVILAVGYGLPITEEQVGLLVVMANAVGGLWLRQLNSPSDTLISDGSDRRVFSVSLDGDHLAREVERLTAIPEARDDRGSIDLRLACAIAAAPVMWIWDKVRPIKMPPVHEPDETTYDRAGLPAT